MRMQLTEEEIFEILREHFAQKDFELLYLFWSTAEDAEFYGATVEVK